jgi:hypothetical protein
MAVATAHHRRRLFFGGWTVKSFDTGIFGLLDTRLGRVGYGPSADYVMFGLMLILIGVIPWKPIFRLLEIRFFPKLRKQRTHVKWQSVRDAQFAVGKALENRYN